VALVRTDISEERITCIIGVKGTSNIDDFFALMIEAIRSSETSVITKATRRHIQEDCIFHSHL
jgi:hypothetical protein